MIEAEDVRLALLVALERLDPVERAVLVLRDVFDVEYSEIADVLDVSPANARQIATRARAHVGDESRRRPVADEAQKRLTGGRFARLLPMPIGVIDTRDPRNGNRHRRCVLYFSDGEEIVVVPSKGGLPSDPFWYRNALADPEVSFESLPFHAEPVVEAAELGRLWALADRFFPACVEYRRRAARSGRTIPILKLSPR